MDNFYFNLKLITVSIGFLFGLMYLYIYLRTRKDKSHLFFSLISIFAALGLLFYRESYYKNLLSWPAKLPLFFNFFYWALLPWFVSSFTGYVNKWMRLLVTGGLALTYLAVFFIGREGDSVVYYALATNVFQFCVFLYLFSSGFFLWRRKIKVKAISMLGTGLIMVLLFLLVSTVNYNIDGYQKFSGHYYPLAFFPLFFMVIMGTEMTNVIIKNGLLEKRIEKHEKNWSALLDKIDLLAFVIDDNGFISEGNRFFIETTRQSASTTRLAGAQLSGLFRRAGDDKIFLDFVKGPDNGKMIQNHLTDFQKNEKIVSWMKICLDDQDNGRTYLCIGNDQTDHINTSNQLQKAFSELESARVQKFEENIIIEESLSAEIERGSKIIGESPAIKYVFMRIQQVAKSDTTVLLEGETGVGKEVIARYLHEQSSRSAGPMIAVNCAAIPGQLLESELFGHERGAFTGADRQKKGRFEIANGGTLFLDEIGELPLELQPKLLRVLQEREIERLGGQSPIKVNVRIIAATNRSLKKEADAGRFRPDLFYRLSTFPITIPPLRQRRQDIPLLAEAFIHKFAALHKKSINQISPSVLDLLMNYEWPGNIRQLQNVIEQSVITANGDVFKLSRPAITEMKSNSVRPEGDDEKILPLEQHERLHILKALQKTQWKISGENGAANLLGINASTLRSRMIKLGITRDNA